VSLIEWFVVAPGESRDAFLAARDLHGPATVEMAEDYLRE
jgi:hypothetical protein